MLILQFVVQNANIFIISVAILSVYIKIKERIIIVFLLIEYLQIRVSTPLRINQQMKNRKKFYAPRVIIGY